MAIPTAQRFHQDIIAYKTEEAVSIALADLQACDEDGFNFCDNCPNAYCPQVYPNKVCKVWQLMNLVAR